MTSEPLRKRNKKYSIEGHAHFLMCSTFQRMPLLTNDQWRTWLAESIRAACVKHSVALWAYVFMPEHFHLLLKPRQAKYNLAEFEMTFKLSASRKILFSLQKSKSPLLEKMRFKKSDGRYAYRFWQPGGGHDLNIWTMKKAIEKAEYCHSNPVKRRLVKSAQDWRWSSFRWLVLGKRENEPLGVD
jgi:putative transposase